MMWTLLKCLSFEPSAASCPASEIISASRRHSGRPCHLLKFLKAVKVLLAFGHVWNGAAPGHS